MNAEQVKGLRELVKKWRDGKVSCGPSDVQLHGAKCIAVLFADELSVQLDKLDAPGPEYEQVIEIDEEGKVHGDISMLRPKCKICGEEAASPKHVRYGADLDNPVKHCYQYEHAAIAEAEKRSTNSPSQMQTGSITSSLLEVRKEYKHWPHCNGSRYIPAGEPGNCCSCFTARPASASPRLSEEQVRSLILRGVKEGIRKSAQFAENWEGDGHLGDAIRALDPEAITKAEEGKG